MPMGVRVAAWAVEGMVYLATSKSFTDHGLSLASGQDCSVLRAVTGEDLCHEWGEDQERADIRVVLGMIEPELKTLGNFETALGEGRAALEMPIFDPYLGDEAVAVAATPAPVHMPAPAPMLAGDVLTIPLPLPPIAEDLAGFDDLAALPVQIPTLTVSFDPVDVDMIDRHGPRRAPFGMLTWTALGGTALGGTAFAAK